MALTVGNGYPLGLGSGLQGVITLWLAFLVLFVLSSRGLELGRNDASKEENLGMMRQPSILNGRSVTTSQQSRDDYIPEEEDLELERQLRVLNKRPIKTFMTEEGDIIDCVDIYKQPAFDNPLLKNHKLQLKPSFFPRRVANETSAAAKPLHVKLKGKEYCPPGTVPIRRTSKEDLIRAKSISRKLPNSFGQQTPSFPGQYRVSLKMESTNLHGVSANIDVYNPSVKAGQFSTAQVWAQNGPYDILNNIQAGWMVNPNLYHDNRTRLFTYWTGDGYHKTGCYNTLCPGFVQTNKEITPSAVIRPISVYGGKQYVIYINVYQDIVTGNWWLMVTDQKKYVGYWPKAIFSHLDVGASSVVWGALAKASADGISPPMGSGHFPFDDYEHSCYFANMKSLDSGYSVINPRKLKEFEDNKNCYDIKNDGHKSKELGFCFRFGGPGGKVWVVSPIFQGSSVLQQECEQ